MCHIPVACRPIFFKVELVWKLENLNDKSVLKLEKVKGHRKKLFLSREFGMPNSMLAKDKVVKQQVLSLVVMVNIN